jgi:hypothetical protein
LRGQFGAHHLVARGKLVNLRSIPGAIWPCSKPNGAALPPCLGDPRVDAHHVRSGRTGGGQGAIEVGPVRRPRVETR